MNVLTSIILTVAWMHSSARAAPAAGQGGGGSTDLGCVPPGWVTELLRQVPGFKAAYLVWFKEEYALAQPAGFVAAAQLMEAAIR